MAASLGPELYEERRPYIARVLQGERVQFEHRGQLRGRDTHFLLDFLPEARDAGGE